MIKPPSAYHLKKALLYPRTLYMRKKESHQTGFIAGALELHYYRPAFYDFIGATITNGHILHEAPINADSLVLDIGAFNGSWAQHIIDRYNPTIYAFEPNPQTFIELQQRADKHPKLKPMLYGVGDVDLDVKITLKGLGSSIFSTRQRDMVADTADAKIKSVATMWKELELDTIDLMKINIEGAEFPLLEKMIEENLLDKVDCYMIQFHEWHPGAYRRRRKILKELSKTHKMVWSYHFIWEQWVRK